MLYEKRDDFYFPSINAYINKNHRPQLSHEFTLSDVLRVVFCRSLFIVLSFFFWLVCLSFFDLWLLITPFLNLGVSFYLEPEQLEALFDGRDTLTDDSKR